MAAPLKDSPEKTTHIEKYDIDLLRAMGIYGANASGKSTVLNAIQFMAEAVVKTHNLWKSDGGLSSKPFLLDPDWASKPSLYELDVLIDKTRYTYGFVIDSTQVCEEWLYAYPGGRKQTWFVRDNSESNEYSFSRLLSGENKIIQRLVRPNSFFLSTAVEMGHHQLRSVFEWFSSKIGFITYRHRKYLPDYTAELYQNARYQPGILSILLGSDPEMTGISVKKDDTGGWNEAIAGISDPARKRRMLYYKSLNEPEVLSFSVLFHYRGANRVSVPIPFREGSQGTKALFGLAGPIVETLSNGGVLCIDELDSSLHPDMAMEIVRWFNDPKKNPNNAQLIFNTHDTNIMENQLRRDQIWFTQKDKSNATHLYSLSDFKPRKEENIKLGYMQGRYGAVPFIDTPELVSSDGANEEP